MLNADKRLSHGSPDSYIVQQKLVCLIP